MKLHTGLGPNPRVVKMFIAEKGLDIPRVDVDLLLHWIARWVEQGGKSLGKPTHFESRDGTF